MPRCQPANQTARLSRSLFCSLACYKSSGSARYWYLTDPLGSIRAVVNGSGYAVDQVTYDADGSITGGVRKGTQLIFKNEPRALSLSRCGHEGASGCREFLGSYSLLYQHCRKSPSF